MSTGTSTNCCDRCGRNLDQKGFIMNLGMKICGVCNYEIQYKYSQSHNVDHLYED